MTLTDKQKKTAWIVGAVLLFVHFLPNILLPFKQALASHGPEAHAGKPPAGRPEHAEAVQPVPTATPSPIDPFSRLMGDWYGTAVNGKGEYCHFKLELAAGNDKPGSYTGYSSRSCGPMPFTAHNLQEGRVKEVLREIAPVSTILNGLVEDGAIHLRLGKAIETPTDGCQPTSFVLRPFGASQMDAVWEEEHCSGGHFLMGRTPR